MTNAATLASYGPFVSPGPAGNLLTSNGSVWTSASAPSGYSGPSSTTYTTAGSFTFTIPTGITKIKATVVGGGGGGSGKVACGPNVAGSSGGTSSISSGTQTISTVSATGGSGATASGASASGGTGSGGDFNGSGGASSGFTGGSIFSMPKVSTAGVLGAGGGSLISGAAGGNAIKWLTGLTPGNTISVTVGAGGAGGSGSGGTGTAGGEGVVLFEY